METLIMATKRMIWFQGLLILRKIFLSDFFHGIYIKKQKKSPNIFYGREYILLVMLKLEYMASILVDETVYKYSAS